MYRILLELSCEVFIRTNQPNVRTCSSIERTWHGAVSNMSIAKIAVLGAGQMGNGITQVAACAGYNVTMIDIKQEFVDRGIAAIEKSLAKLVSKERMSQEDADSARGRISLSVDRADCAAVSYTHLRAHETGALSRMPSSA